MALYVIIHKSFDILKWSSFWSTLYMLCIVYVCVVFGTINAVKHVISISIRIKLGFIIRQKRSTENKTM